MIIWVLNDERAGNNKQPLAIAELIASQIPSEIIIKTLDYNKLAKLPYLAISKLYSINNKDNFLNQTDSPNIIIAAGRKAGIIAMQLKKIYKAQWIHLMWPGIIANFADVILLPSHDQKRLFNYKTIRTVGTPTLISEVKMLEETSKFPELKEIKNPIIAVLIGGSSNDGEFTTKSAKLLCQRLNNIMDQDYHLLISTSRRTGNSQIKIFKEQLQGNFNLYIPGEGENPYFAYLNLAQQIIVTADSIAMLSEAVATNKPVYYHDDEQLSGKKHKRFLQTLTDNNLIRNLDNFASEKLIGRKLDINQLNLNLVLDILHLLKLK